VWTERDIVITERGRRDTCLGNALQVKVWAHGHPLLSWREVWEAFVQAYPGKWAIQVFPPKEKLVDGKAVYHLWVLESEPEGLNLKRAEGRGG
jgi:hypothetical protein